MSSELAPANLSADAIDASGVSVRLASAAAVAGDDSRLASATAVAIEIDKRADPARAAGAQRYFQAVPGGYGYPDQFSGVTVPQVRAVVRRARDLEIGEIEQLAVSPIHEHRLAALLIMVAQAKRAKSQRTRDELATSYLRLLHSGHINNWDLVDTSAPTVLGGWVGEQNPKPILDLVASDNLWVRRAGILAAFWLIGQGKPQLALGICAEVLDDRRDLIQKASGWALREIGKRCGREHLITFLESHAATMPRTMLRYAIEHLDEPERKRWLAAKTRQAV